MVRKRVVTVHNVNYGWHIKQTESGNVLVVKNPLGKINTIFIGKKNITPKVVSYQIKRFVIKGK